MIDLDGLRRVIADAPLSGPAAVLSRDSLAEIERELASGAAARVELARVKAFDTVREELTGEGAGG